MLLVYSKHNSPRHNYVFQFILGEMLGLDFKFTAVSDEFIAFDGLKFNYSEDVFEGIPSIKPFPLLNESGIRQLEIRVFENAGAKAFFKTGDRPCFPYDLFSACFYMLSRYEEYLPKGMDKEQWENQYFDQHGRFKAEESLAYKSGFLQQPVVNLWINQFKEYLKPFFPEIAFKQHQYKFISTIDVDNGYAYKGKSLVKTAGGIGRFLVKANLKEGLNRLQVVLGLKRDPFDEYAFQRNMKEEFGLEMIYFFLCGIGSTYDHNISVYSKAFQSLVDEIKGFSSIGLHPSYASHFIKGGITLEKIKLEQAAKTEITRSRQHFLKLNLPETYQELTAAGIKEDYSMAFASQPGFRAGIAHPFPFYDLSREEEVKLTIHAFQAMEVTFKDYLKIGSEEALVQISELIKTVKAVEGTFISVWHDRTFARTKENQPWIDLYIEMIKAAK